MYIPYTMNGAVANIWLWHRELGLLLQHHFSVNFAGEQDACYEILKFFTYTDHCQRSLQLHVHDKSLDNVSGCTAVPFFWSNKKERQARKGKAEAHCLSFSGLSLFPV